MERDQFDKYVNYVTSHLPNNLSKELQLQIEGQVRLKLVEFRQEIINSFCKKHNLCSICITGGYDCDSDHK